MVTKLNEKAHVSTIDGWEILETSFDPEQKITSGSNYMIGNGYLGYRGTFCHDQKSDYTACIVTDTFDMADGKWRELCNAPNPLFLKIISEGFNYDLEETGYISYEKQLDLRKAILSRKTTFSNGLTVETERFSSMADEHLLALKYEVMAEENIEFTVITGIDGDVWSLNGDHFKRQDAMTKNDLFINHVVTKEYETDIYVVEARTYSKEASTQKITKSKSRILEHSTFSLSKGETLEIIKFSQIFTSNDLDSPKAAAINSIHSSLSKGYNTLKEEHVMAWEKLWNHYDIKINGNKKAQTLTRFNLYHNIIATPRHKIHPIGARGLSCQAYQGAAFWDQEIFNMPMFLYSTPDIARNILKYRYDTLNGARKKAKDLGYEGAFYAWISGKTGEELCPDYFFKNVLTGRKIRNHFNIWQIHISPDITYAITKYYEATDDWIFIEDYGAEMIFEIARFIESRVHFKVNKNQYEIIRVLGPDEWHENVDNNTFTNYQCKFALKVALDIYEEFNNKNPKKLKELLDRLNMDSKTLSQWQDIENKMFIHKPDPETKLVEQFDGFFKLEDITPNDLSKRLINDEEYWGWPNGIAVRTQVSKQADLVQLMVMHDHLYDQETMKENYYYYEKRCRHGSSLSPAMHAIIACKIGDESEAFKYFEKSSAVDLFNTNEAVVGGTFIGGIHTAAAGAVWQVIVFGFAGISFLDNSVEVNPRLPENFDSLEFNLTYKNQSFHLKIYDDIIFITSDKDNTLDLEFIIMNKSHIIKKHSTNKIPL